VTMAESKQVRRPFVGGNWKMFGTKSSVAALVTALNASVGSWPSSTVEAVVAPTNLHLDYVLTNLTALGVSAQNCAASEAMQAALTGENSAGQLFDFGIRWVILGHSERRKFFHETDAVVAEKVTGALKAGLSVIACIGETLEERKANQTVAVVVRQLCAIIDAVTKSGKPWTNVVIAYEPVWAIGTGVVASPEQAQEVHVEIRGSLRSGASEAVANSTRIIYGGSVKGDNCDALFSKPDVDGFLVGGASLIAADFVRILNAKGKDTAAL